MVDTGLSDSARAALDALGTMGWSVQRAAERRPLPPHIDSRYPAIPPPVRAFIEALDGCSRRGEQVWFLTSADYAADDDSAIGWNEWERLEDDGRKDDRVRTFWDKHLPILNAVAGDYAYLAVCVDQGSKAYGNIVRGDAPDFRETTTVCASFDDLLLQIAKMPQGSVAGDLADLLLDPHDERNLGSHPNRGFFGTLTDRIRALPLFERYRIGVVVEAPMSRPLWVWENWSQIMPYLTAVTKGLDAQAMIRPRQAGDRDNWLRFGPLPWNEKNNRTWTTKYLTDPKLAGKVEFFATEIWAPGRATSFETQRGPELFCLLDHSHAENSQGFVLAIRKDLLRRVDFAADDTIFAVREFFEKSTCEVFERRWGEIGRFGSTLVSNGLERTDSGTVLAWAKGHRQALVRSFRWRGAVGR